MATGDGPAAPAKGRRGLKRSILLLVLAAGGARVGYMAWWGSTIDPRPLGVNDLEGGPAAQVIAWDGDRTAVQVSALSRLPADHLWRVVTDQGRFDEFMPYVRSTEVRPGQDGALIETQVLDLPHASYDLELEIRLVEEGGVRTARWRQTRGTLAFNEGAWVVERAGDHTILRYQVSASLAWAPQWAINHALGRRLGRLLDAVETRVRALEGSEPEYFRGG